MVPVRRHHSSTGRSESKWGAALYLPSPGVRSVQPSCPNASGGRSAGKAGSTVPLAGHGEGSPQSYFAVVQRRHRHHPPTATWEQCWGVSLLPGKPLVSPCWCQWKRLVASSWLGSDPKDKHWDQLLYSEQPLGSQEGSKYFGTRSLGNIN